MLHTLHQAYNMGCCRFLGLNLGSVFLWYRKQRLDEEAYGGHQALLTEGLAPSMALFVVCAAAWCECSALHWFC